MNWHQIKDQRSWEMHQVIADILRRSPEGLVIVSEKISRRLADPDFSDTNKDALCEWLKVIESEGLAGVLRVLDDRGEDATRMRQSSPFAMLMPQDKRLEILEKYEAQRTRASLAGV